MSPSVLRLLTAVFSRPLFPPFLPASWAGNDCGPPAKIREGLKHSRLPCGRDGRKHKAWVLIPWDRLRVQKQLLDSISSDKLVLKNSFEKTGLEYLTWQEASPKLCCLQECLLIKLKWYNLGASFRYIYVFPVSLGWHLLRLISFWLSDLQAIWSFKLLLFIFSVFCLNITW